MSVSSIQSPNNTTPLQTCVDAQDRQTIVVRDVEVCPENSLPVTSSRPVTPETVEAETRSPEKNTAIEIPIAADQQKSMLEFLQKLEAERRSGALLQGQKYRRSLNQWRTSLSIGVPIITSGSGLIIAGAVVGGIRLGAKVGRAAANLEITALDTKIDLLNEGIQRLQEEDDSKPQDIQRLQDELKDTKADLKRAQSDLSGAKDTLHRLKSPLAPALLGLGAGLVVAGAILMLVKGRRPRETDFAPYSLMVRGGVGFGIQGKF